MYPTKDALDLLFDYCPLTGIVTHAVDKCSNAKKGLVAGKFDADGYLVLSANRKQFRGHRCIWIMVYGEEPNGLIDHANGNKSDNRIGNLRVATASQNAINRKINARNTSGYKGVSWDRYNKKWKAEIRRGKRRIFQKRFDTKEEAISAVMAAREQLDGEFARHE